jgi:hypothetical protein
MRRRVHTSARRKPGFTMLEVAVVTAIVSTMVILLLPAVQRARESARRSTCKNNLMQIGLALHNYHEDYGCFPMPYSLDYPHDESPPGPEHSLNTHSWGQMLLPYLGRSELYGQIDMNVPSMSQETAELMDGLVESYGGAGGEGYSDQQVENIWNRNEAAIMNPMEIFACPTVPGGPRRDKHIYYDAAVILGLDPEKTYVTYASTDYASINGVLSRFTGTYYTGPVQANREGIMRQPNEVTRKRDVVDGLGKTWMISERGGANDVWRDGAKIWDAGAGTFIEDAGGGDYNVQSGGGWGDFVNGEFWLAGSLEDGTGTRGPCLINCTNLDTRGIYSFHPGGIHVLLGDASAKFVSEAVHTDIVVQAISSDGLTPGGEF